jgi:hypothetical protein
MLNLHIIKKNSGSVLVELAIVTPIVLILLFFIYWLFLSLTWKQALRDSAVKGVDLAQTRGDPVQMGERSGGGSILTGGSGGLLPPIETYLDSNGSNWNTLGNATTAGLLANHQSTPVSTYNTFLTKTFSHKGSTLYTAWTGVSLSDFNSQTLYAMAYAYENMKIKVGSFIKYPCDFTDESDLEPGCAICVPAGPNLLGVTDPADTTIFGIQCFLQPMDSVVTPMLKLMGINDDYRLIFESSAFDETQEGYNN